MSAETKSDNKTEKKINVLACGVDSAVLPLVLNKPIYETKELKTPEEFETSYENVKDGEYDLLLCGDQFGESFTNEFAQIMKQQCPAGVILYITAKREGFQAKNFIKNGFTQALIWPADKFIFDEKSEELLAAVGQSARSYKSVHIVDVDPKTELPFATYVYLPLNNKYVRFSAEKQPMGEEKMNRLKEKEFGKLFLDKKKMSDFYAYSASRLKTIDKDATMSQTEKEEKLKGAVRGLFADMFDKSQAVDFQSGKEMVASCQKVISNFITGGRTENWYSKLVMAIGGAANSYDHAATVSSVAALLAIGIGHPRPEDVALASFFHDLGRIDFPEELILKPESEWPAGLAEVYHQHPVASVNIIKERKMVVSPEVEKAILQHHEKFSGKGFPKQLAGDRISLEAQLVSLADQFYYLTEQKEGQKRLTPKEAMQEIKLTGSIGPELLRKVEKLMS